MQESLELMAFWKYDIFPYILCGKVTKMHKNGRVSAKGFEGYTFQPLMVMPYELGLSIKEKINQISHQYNIEKKELFNKHMKQLIDIVQNPVSDHFNQIYERNK